ncbi:MAG: thioesterase family protein [Pseudomonadales bacterium]|nr:thioesterase family protein [Pseudomonadales bacterium]
MTDQHTTTISDEEKARILQDRLKTAFNVVPFNNTIGLTITDITADTVTAQFAMQPQLIGNVFRQVLHGGVIATALDTVGGAIGMVGVYSALKGTPKEQKTARLNRFATIDMRIDYLKAGRGELFTATASLLRVGKQICVTRMELHNEKQELIAAGTATYMY